MKEITKALLKAQGEFTKIAKDSKNPHFKNTYASLPNILSIVLPILRDNQVLLTTSTIQKDNTNYTHVKLIHTESGEFIESHLPILNISDPQKMGSCITYNQRYGLLPLLGISADIDDDGNRASNKDEKSLSIEKKKEQLKSILKGFTYDEKIQQRAESLITDPNVDENVLNNALIKLKEIALESK